ncbi:MAG: flavodoxin family protein [Desulfomonile tiedjei]|nr:flavodoxin family protein [Desulfomonile tiedjei]
MRIETVLGSPRKKGNTGKVLGWVEEALEARGHSVNRIQLVDHKINGCKGCWTCKKSKDKPGCPQKDDAVEILERLLDSDLVLYATPVYFWGPTAQIKAFVDRHCSLVTGYGTAQWQSLMAGKRIGLVVTCEDGIENNVDLLAEMFKRFADYLKCDHAGEIVIPFASKPDAMGDQARARAIAFANQL